MDRLDVLAVLRVVGVDVHRPELEERELLHVLAKPGLAEEDGTRSVALDAQREVREQRSGDQESQSKRATMSIVRLTTRADGESRTGGNPISGSVSIVCISTLGPTASKSRGTRSICTEIAFSLWMTSSRSSWESREYAIITRSMPNSSTSWGSCSGDPSRSSGVEIGSRLSRLDVDEANQSDRVLGMLLKLARDQLADLSRSHDDRVLPEHRLPSSHRPRERSASDDERDRHRPEGEHPWRVRLPERGERDQPGEQPCADRDDGEDPGEVVDGRVIGALDGSTVEPAQLRDDYPEW